MLELFNHAALLIGSNCNVVDITRSRGGVGQDEDGEPVADPQVDSGSSSDTSCDLGGGIGCDSFEGNGHEESSEDSGESDLEAQGDAEVVIEDDKETKPNAHRQLRAHLRRLGMALDLIGAINKAAISSFPSLDQLLKQAHSLITFEDHKVPTQGMNVQHLIMHA
jgi:hypothetical protein